MLVILLFPIAFGKSDLDNNTAILNETLTTTIEETEINGTTELTTQNTTISTRIQEETGTEHTLMTTISGQIEQNTTIIINNTIVIIVCIKQNNNFKLYFRTTSHSATSLSTSVTNSGSSSTRLKRDINAGNN